MIVCKFGGTSVATEESIREIKKIIFSDIQRKIIVVSAPGKTEEHNKITDCLIDVYNEKDCSTKNQKLREIYLIFDKIVQKLCIKYDFFKDFEEKTLNFEQFSYARLLSIGEYFSAKILSYFFELPFVDPYELIFFRNKKVDIKKSKKAILSAFNKHKKFITGGFFGQDEFGNVEIFSRGGSDITGAILAKCLNADIYENWTDVDGMFLNFDTPKKTRLICTDIVHAKMQCIKGARVLHKDTFLYLKNTNCKILLKNTHNPLCFGTLIE